MATNSELIADLERDLLKSDIPDFTIGDTIEVHQRIVEGDKERIQIFKGTVIARKGKGMSETVSLHRVAYGEGMERVFLIHSPRIAQFIVVRQGRARRAKLYHLRGTKGKKAKVRDDVGRMRKASLKAAAKVADASEKEEVAKAPAKKAKSSSNASPKS